MALDRDSRAYRQLRRIVDGAVADALAAHPDYLTKKGLKSARGSITKRVTGAVLGYAGEVWAADAARGRSGAATPAAEPESGGHNPFSWAALTSAVRRLWRCGRRSRDPQGGEGPHA